MRKIHLNENQVFLLRTLLKEYGEKTQTTTQTTSGGNGVSIQTNGDQNVTIDGQKIGNLNKGTTTNDKVNAASSNAAKQAGFGNGGASGPGANALKTISNLANQALGGTNEMKYVTKRMLKERRKSKLVSESRCITKSEIKKYINELL